MNIFKDESGAALILAILMIGLLAVIGVFSTQMSTTETKIARNEKLHKVCLHEADGGAQIGIELLRRNIEDRGFTVSAGVCTFDNVSVNASVPKFYMNTAITSSVIPDSTNFSATIPAGATGIPITTILIGGNPTQLGKGAAMHMMAGYEQKGKAAASGGAWKTYDVRSRHQDVDNSDSTVNVGWRHVM